MNREWSELNRTLQLQLKKKDTFSNGLETLILLRSELMKQIIDFRSELSEDQFSAMPFPRAEGYHSKTVAYSLWHIFRIEDIVAHTLIAGDEQVFLKGDYQRRIKSPIITTANELAGEEIKEFSAKLSVDELYRYITDVDAASAELIKSLSFSDMKKGISQERRHQLEEMQVVSEDEKAVWLIDYWCGKDIRGLLQMPFSRHWIMHIEACLRIKNKLLGVKVN